MSSVFRYDWGSRFEDVPPVPFDPVGLGTFSVREPWMEAHVYRGDVRADDGYRLPYRLWLPDRAPRAAVLLVHGVCDYAGAFDFICPYFATLGYAVLAFDQRGFGQTRTRGKWPGTRRLARDVGDAASFLKRRVPSVPLFVVGESMGGALAVLAATRGHLNGVAGMALVAPGALGCAMRRFLFGLVVRTLKLFGARADLFVERVNCDDLSADAAIRLLADPLVLRRISPALMGGLVQLGERVYDAAPEVDVPTLTLVGTREDVSPLRCIRSLRQRFKGDATLVEFENGPHLLLHWRERDRVLETIGNWIDARLPARVEFCAAR
ncbi:MAG: alpha/beta fold hydrolase [Alphaproteobacteria bacterium]|nr:alpha/beta fold hydrolase [Alphaproteobacteria bacterium]